MQKEFENDNKLNQDKQKKTKKISLLVLLIGLTLGLMMIGIGIKNQSSINSNEYSIKINQQLTEETNLLKAKAFQLKAKGVKYNQFAKYQDGDEYDLKIITNVLDPSFAYWRFDEYEDHPLTSKYCELREAVYELENGGLSFKAHTFIPLYIVGGFIIITCSMISIAIYTSKHKSKLTGFQSLFDSTLSNFTNTSKENTNQLKKCKYCGSLVKIDETECESCGGKEFKKHKN